MRKLLVTALTAGALSMTGGWLAAAHAVSTCSDAGGLPTVGTGGAQVCVNQGPIQGTATASGDPVAQTGYVVVDGSPTNPGPLGGYIGVDSDNGGEVVACSGQGATTDADGNTLYSGDYQPGAGTPADGSGNNQVVGSDGTVSLPAPLGTGNGCDAHQ